MEREENESRKGERGKRKGTDTRKHEKRKMVSPQNK